ncbi:MAG: tetratricopeptide repeat protein [Pseudomonadales bacterium]
MQAVKKITSSRRDRSLSILLLMVLLSACSSQAKKDAQWAENHELYSGTDASEFSKLLVKDDGNFETQGNTYYTSGELDKALYAYLRALAVDENNADLYVKIGTIHRQRTNKRLAQIAFNKALQLDSQNVWAMEKLGLLALREREYEVAAEHFRSAITVDKQRLEEIALSQGEVSTIFYDERSPYRSYNGLGIVLDLQKSYREAVAFYRTAALIKPDQAYIANNIGYSFYLSDFWDEAELNYKNALKIDSSYQQANRNLALLHVRRAEYSEALATMWSLLDTSAAYNTVGYLCMLVGQFDVAEQYLLKAIDSSPSYYDLAFQNLQKNQTLQKSNMAYN